MNRSSAGCTSDIVERPPVSILFIRSTVTSRSLDVTSAWTALSDPKTRRRIFDYRTWYWWNKNQASANPEALSLRFFKFFNAWGLRPELVSENGFWWWTHELSWNVQINEFESLSAGQVVCPSQLLLVMGPKTVVEEWEQDSSDVIIDTQHGTTNISLWFAEDDM